MAEKTDHQHQIKPVDGRLLTREEVKSRKLTGFYYISARCTLADCDYVEISPITAQAPRPRRPSFRSNKLH